MSPRAVGRLLVFLVLSAAAIAQQPTPVYLNHVTISVSDETFSAIAATTFLTGQFSAFDNRTSIVDADAPSPSLCFLGQSTYLEFIHATPSVPPGSVAFAMSVDDRKTLPKLRGYIQNELRKKTQLQRHTRRVQNADVPWVDSISVDWLPPGPIAFSVLAYYPDYFAALDPAFSTAGKSITRSQSLARQYQPAHFLRNIRRITIWSQPREIEAVFALLGAFGYSQRVNGDVKTARGPEAEFVFVPLSAGEQPKIELNFDLNQGYPGLLNLQFPDKSELNMFSSIARWIIPSPPIDTPDPRKTKK